MTKIYENYSECPIVEQLIWDQLANEYGEFTGVKQLTKRDLLTFQFAINQALEYNFWQDFQNQQEDRDDD